MKIPSITVLTSYISVIASELISQSQSSASVQIFSSKQHFQKLEELLKVERKF